MKIFLLIFLLKVSFLNMGLLLWPVNSYSAEENFSQLRSSRFIVNYSQGVSRGYAQQIKERAEYFYQRITQEFGFLRDSLWLWDQRAQIFIAKDRQEYLDNFNCPDWSAACVDYRRKKIYTYSGQDNFISNLAHELTHIIFREYLRQDAVPLWLDEGVAMYIETKFAGARYRQNLGLISRQIGDGSYIPFQEMAVVDALTLKSKPSSFINTFYLQSFSVIDFMIRQYQPYRFSRFLQNLRQGDSLKRSLNRAYYQFQSLSDLEKAWKKFYSR